MLTLSARYEIIREIGSGASAVVYLAQDTLLRRQVALKKLHPHLLDLEESQLRFEKEAVAVASLSHENIVRLHDVIQEERRWSLALEFISGPSLEALIAQAGGSLGPLATVALARQALEGLSEAHRKGVIHRDIKPSNLLVNEEGVVKLTDFGIAFLADDASVTRTGYILGTPQFMSPEQASGEAITDKADVFALGVIVFRCLCGRFPVAGRTAKEIFIAMAHGQITPIHAIQPRLIPGMGDWVMRLLSAKPLSRPSALEALNQLNQLLSQVNLQAEKKDLAAYLSDAKAAKADEEARLSRHFHALAVLKRTAGQGAIAIRYAGLAQLFEVTQAIAGWKESVEPEIWKKPEPTKTSRPLLGRVAILGSAILALGLFAGWHTSRSKIERERHPSTANASSILSSNRMTVPPISMANVSYSPSQALQEMPPKGSGVNRAANTEDGERPERQTPASIQPIEGVANHTQVESLELIPAIIPPAAAMRIRTFPAFMTVWLGDSLWGQTPITAWRNASFGNHRLRLIRDEKTYLDTNLFLNPGDSLDMKLRLSP